MRRSLAENFGQPVMWHYSRFPFSSARCSFISSSSSSSSASWCKTQLFYSSPSVAGPVSLYPLVKDGTLLARQPLSRNRGGSEQEQRDFVPQFIQLTWNIDKLMTNFQSGSLCPIQILDFGIILQQKLISEVYMKVDAFEEIVIAAHAQGLNQFPSEVSMCVDHGMEKVLAVLMYLTARPGLVGFRYSHTFSAVREPDTLCLIGCAASYLLTPSSTSSSRASLLLDLCRFVKGPHSDPTKKGEHDCENVGELAGIAMEIVSRLFLGIANEASSPSPSSSSPSPSPSPSSSLLFEDVAPEKKIKMLKEDFDFVKTKVLPSLHEDLELQKFALVKVENEQDETYLLVRKQMMRMGLLKAAVEHFESSSIIRKF